MSQIILGTSCYQNAKTGNLVSITGDGGNAWGFYGPSYKKLAPSWKLYQYWSTNPDHLQDDELIEHYIKEYIQHRLSNLNPTQLLPILQAKFGQEIIFLCHELPSNSNQMSKIHFCHRRIVADILELTTNIHIPEIQIDESGNIKILEQPNYKPLIKKYLK